MLDQIVAGSLSFLNLLSPVSGTKYEAFSQNPAPIYAQVSKEKLSDKLKEEAIKIKGDKYKKSVIEKHGNESAIKEALAFYNGVIQNHKNSNYLAEAYLNSGRLICCTIENKDTIEGTKRLKKASEIAIDINVKADAVYLLGFIKRYSTDPEDFKEAKEYFEEIIKLLPPEHDLVKNSKEMLQQLESQKIK